MHIPAPSPFERLKGSIRATLFVHGDSVERVEIISSRPQLAQRLLAGHMVREVVDRVGRIYTLCVPALPAGRTDTIPSRLIKLARLPARRGTQLAAGRRR